MINMDVLAVERNNEPRSGEDKMSEFNKGYWLGIVIANIVWIVITLALNL